MKRKSKKNSKSKLIALAIILIAVFVFLLNKKSVPTPDKGSKSPIEKVSTIPDVAISEQDIKEENFKGSKSIIVGSGALADSARKYIDDEVTSFKQSADQDVPDMRSKFGVDSPVSQYEINLKATYVKSGKTHSIIIDEYIYTGGANGNDSYKVFTASNSTGEILSLSDIIKSSKQDAFVSLVKKSLLAFRPEGAKEQVVFPEEVQALTFDSLSNWSMGKNNLIIYFDKFAVGPGVLGAIAFPMPYSKLGDILVDIK